MSRRSFSSLTSLFSHLQNWDKFCLYRVYRPINVLGELKVCPLNHHIQFFAGWLTIFIWGYRASSFSPFPFQAHLRWACDLLPLVVQVSIPPFEQLWKRGMDHVRERAQAFIFQHNLIVVFKLSLHLAEMLCRPKFNYLAFCDLVILYFRMAFDIFFLELHIRLGLLHPMAHGFF